MVDSCLTQKHSSVAGSLTFVLKAFSLLSVPLILAGCSDLALFDANGPVGQSIADSMTYTTLLMLVIIIPTIFLSVFIPYHYRSGNKKARYEPEWYHSTVIEIIIWGIPILIVGILGVEAYKSTHALDPRKPIITEEYDEEDALKIQVVALNWKWLFIYPEEGIATINEIGIPVDRPVEFLLTSDGGINSFFVPRLGSQLYAMNGMESRLYLMADEPGVMDGMSANYSGFGFSGMRFKVHATDEGTYNQWINKVKNEGTLLDDAAYDELKQKSRDNPVEYFVNADPLRFKNIIDSNANSYGLQPIQQDGPTEEDMIKESAGL